MQGYQKLDQQPFDLKGYQGLFQKTNPYVSQEFNQVKKLSGLNQLSSKVASADDFDSFDH